MHQSEALRRVSGCVLYGENRAQRVVMGSFLIDPQSQTSRTQPESVSQGDGGEEQKKKKIPGRSDKE